MKHYLASEELAEILKLNGFKDITQERYPDHHNSMVKNGYDPGKIKRVFAANKFNYIKFDYISIQIFYKKNLEGDKDELSIDELKSIIVFFNLPVNIRTELIKRGQKVLSLHQRYDEIKKEPEFYNDQKSKMILKSFESLTF